ncbi:MAG: 1-phosphofructokinase [Clostridia bacterium]|nr:1-phosphofructokinase [Clostridia bacterium]
MNKILIVMLNPAVDVTLSFDGFEKSKTNRTTDEISSLGGKGLNVSLVSKSFGLDVCLAGFIGEDRKEELSSVLKDNEIENAFVEVCGKTRTNFKLLDTKENSITEANGQGFCVTDEDLSKISDVISKKLAEAEILVLTGSLPKGVNSDFYAKCVEMANEKGVKTILDASGKALKMAIDKKPFAIKPNIEELCEYFGEEIKDEKEIVCKVKDLLSSGIDTVCVSLGKDGAILAKGESIYRAKTFPVEVKSTVGAGDSMVGAMCYAITNGLDLEKSLKLMVSAGCKTSSKKGTELCKKDEVFDSEKKVKTQELVL